MIFSFSYYVSFFFTIFLVLQCFCPIFHVFHFSRHNPGSAVCISHFPRFWVFLAIFKVKQCLCLIFHIFQFSCHTAGLTIYIYHFFRFVSVSHHIPGHTVCLICHVFQFSRHSPGLLCVFLIFHVFHCLTPYSRS